jgi:hypothetical protein
VSVKEIDKICEHCPQSKCDALLPEKYIYSIKYITGLATSTGYTSGNTLVWLLF